MIVATFDPTADTSNSFNTKLPINGKFLLTNQSNVNLTITFADGTTAYAPAWQISPFRLPTPYPNVTWSQQSMLAGQSSPISQVTIDTYQPNENLPGIYPVSIQHATYVGNSVSTTAVVNSLSNEGSGANTEVIDIGTNNNSKLIDIFNDHFTWKVEQSGTAHTVLTGRTSGKPIMIGQVGDHVEIADVLDVDGRIFVDGRIEVDSGDIATDGSGNIEVITISNSHGLMHSPFVETTSYRFANTTDITSGNTIVFTIVGNGSPTIPSDTKFVMISCYWTGSTAGTFMQIYPLDATNTDPSNWPLFGQTEGGNNKIATNGIVPLGTDGKIVVSANSGDITGFNACVYAYFA